MFKDRIDAATQLSTKLMDLFGKSDLLVLGISVGGMVTAHEVAHQLNASCDMLAVRKLRVPEHLTEPLGAIAMGGDTVFNRGIIEHFNVSKDLVSQIEADEQQHLSVQERIYRGTESAPLNIRGRTIVLVDDGMGTGVTMRAAIDAMKAQSAQEIIVATPVAAPQVAMMFEGIADRTVCLMTPRPFESVEHWYDNFDKPTDDEIRNIINSGTLMTT